MYLSLLGEQQSCQHCVEGDCWLAANREPTIHGTFRLFIAPLQACQAMEHLQHMLEAPGLPTQSTLLRRTLDVAGSNARTLFDVVQAGFGYSGPTITSPALKPNATSSSSPT